MPSASPSLRLWHALAAGAALGIVYAASPVTVLCLACLAALVAAAVRGLEGRERACVQVVLLAAVGVRLVAVAALYLFTAHDRIVSFPWDGDGVFLIRRGFLLSRMWEGVPLEPETAFAMMSHEYGWTSYQYVLAYLQHLFGVAPYALHLVNVVLFVAAVVGLYRLSRACYGRRPAFAALVVLLFLPTVLLWSVSALKESLYLFLNAVAVIAAVACVRGSQTRTRVLAFAILVAAIAANHTVRDGAALIMIAGVTFGVVGAAIVRRPILLVGSLIVIAVAIPVSGRSRVLRDGVRAQLVLAGERHIGNVRTEGHGYKLLDQRIYSESSPGGYDAVPTMTAAERMRFLVRGLASIVLVPLPWTASSRSEVLLLGQQALWYVMAIFAIVGVGAGIRRDPLVTLILAGMSAVGAVVIALSNGNIGTLVRFRDTLVPFVVWLSALGAAVSVRWLIPRTRRAGAVA